MSPEIRILNGTTLRELAFEETRRTLREVFGLPVNLERSTLDLQRAFDSLRKQSNSTEVLTQMLEAPCDIDSKQIAVVEVDLFIPVLTFVFGEAQLGGVAAVVSTHRLSNPFYGLPRDDGLVHRRLEKEIVHELGHTFGLYHCHQFECVMRSSTYVEEIDIKRPRPCTACAALLHAESHAVRNAYPGRNTSRIG